MDEWQGIEVVKLAAPSAWVNQEGTGRTAFVVQGVASVLHVRPSLHTNIPLCVGTPVEAVFRHHLQFPVFRHCLQSTDSSPQASA